MDSSLPVPEIKLVPIGTVDAELLEYLALTLSGNFGLRCDELRAGINPQLSYNPNRRQYNSTSLLLRLSALDLAGTKVLGVTEVDLFIPILTFVFGEAQLGGGAALISTHRLDQQFYGLPPDKDLLLTRAEKEATHELGHAYGLAHCMSYDCVMHFSNSVEQVDLRPSVFCPPCHRMLRVEAQATVSV